MNRVNRLYLALAAGCLAVSQPSLAESAADAGSRIAVPQGSAPTIEKAVSTQTLGSRATVTSSDTMYGGFEIRSAATVYIAVRGNSLGTLGVTQEYLDAPRTRLYNGQGVDLAFDGNGNAGFNGCVSGSTFSGPVVSFYQNVRGQPVAARDSCVAAVLAAGTYTFSVTPSIPGVTTVSTASVPTFGEVLFEVTLNP